MLIGFKILFLSISILFSFGYTAFDANCNHLEKTVVKDSCCHGKEDQSHGKEKQCCNESCCLEPLAILQLNAFVSHTSKEKQTNTVYKTNFKFIFEPKIIAPVYAIKNIDILKKQLNFGLNINHESFYQCWLI